MNTDLHFSIPQHQIDSSPRVSRATLTDVHSGRNSGRVSQIELKALEEDLAEPVHIPKMDQNQKFKIGLMSLLEPQGQMFQIIRKEDRTDEEAWILYQYLKDYQFFNLFTNMTNEVYQKEYLLHIFKRLKYEEFSAGEVIFEEGESSNGKMYVVLSGKVLVMTRKMAAMGHASAETTQKVYNLFRGQTNDEVRSESASGRRRSTKKSPRTSQLDLRRTSSSNSNQSWNEEPKETAGLSKFRKFKHPDPEEESPKNDTEISKYGHVKDTIEKGGYFGERALETNQHRSASILTETDCQFLSLTKEEFALIKGTFRNKIRELFDFVIESIPGLNYIQRPLISDNYLFLFEERVFSFKNHLFKEGEKGDQFYLIYSGACQVYRTIVIEEAKKENQYMQFQKTKEKIPLAIVNEGSMVGEEIVQSENAKYQYSVEVTSDSCRVLVMNKTRFRIKFTLEILEEIKARYQEKTLNKNQILLEHLIKKDLELVDKSLNKLFLKTKRKAVPVVMNEEIAKLQGNQPYYLSGNKSIPSHKLHTMDSDGKIRKKEAASNSFNFANSPKNSISWRPNLSVNTRDNDTPSSVEDSKWFSYENSPLIAESPARSMKKSGYMSPLEVKRTSLPTQQFSSFKKKQTSVEDIEALLQKKPLPPNNRMFFPKSPLGQGKNSPTFASYLDKSDRIVKTEAAAPNEYFLSFPADLNQGDLSPILKTEESTNFSYGSTPFKSNTLRSSAPKGKLSQSSSHHSLHLNLKQEKTYLPSISSPKFLSKLANSKKSPLFVQTGHVVSGFQTHLEGKKMSDNRKSKALPAVNSPGRMKKQSPDRLKVAANALKSVSLEECFMSGFKRKGS